VVTEENNEPVATGEVTGSHCFADNGEYLVTLTVTDDDGGVGTDTAIVIVSNVGPIVNAGSDQTVSEGDTVSFSGGFTDPGTDDTHTIEWDFGDGNNAYDALTPTHTYMESGAYTVTLTVIDDDGGVGTDTAIVSALMLPVADAGSGQTVDEGDVVNLDASESSGTGFGTTYDWIDAATLGVRDDYLSITNDGYVLYDLDFTFNFYGNDYTQIYVGTNGYLTFGSGYLQHNNYGATLPSTSVPPNMISPAFFDICPYYGGDVYIYKDITSSPKKFVVEWHHCALYSLMGSNTMEVILYENDLIKCQYGYSSVNWGQDALGYYPLVGIQNQDSTIGIEYRDDVDQSLFDGLAIDFYSSSNTWIDRSGGGYYPITYYSWDFDGDGIHDYQETSSDAPDGLFDGKTTHVYGDNGVYIATLQVIDDTGAAATDTFTVTVNNVAPTANIDAVLQPHSGIILPNDMLEFYGSFTDPGTDDTHTIEWDFGDGNNAYDTLTPTHTYVDSGTYTVILTVTDDDGDMDVVSVLIVVENPAGTIESIIEDIEDMNLAKGIETALISKLNAAINSLDKTHINAAINQLNAFINQVESQRGKKLTDEQADSLTVAAQWIIDDISSE